MFFIKFKLHNTCHLGFNLNKTFGETSKHLVKFETIFVKNLYLFILSKL